MSSDVNGLTQTAYAKHAKLTRGRVGQLIVEGMPVIEGGQIDPVTADAWRRANSSPARQAANRKGRMGRPFIGGAGKLGTTADARRRKLEADAGMSELKFRERHGELIRKADAELFLFEKGREIRDSWLSWLARIAPAMAAELDIEPQLAFSWLDKAVRAHLLELSKIKLEAAAEVEEEAEVE